MVKELKLEWAVRLQRTGARAQKGGIRAQKGRDEDRKGTGVTVCVGAEG